MSTRRSTRGPGNEGLTAAVTTLIDEPACVETRVLVEAVASMSGDDGETPPGGVLVASNSSIICSGAGDDAIRLKFADTWGNVTEITREMKARGVAGARLKVPVEELWWYYGEIVAIVCGRLAPDDVLRCPSRVRSRGCVGWWRPLLPGERSAVGSRSRAL